MLFLGGSFTEGLNYSVPVICALSFDRDLKLIELQKISDFPRLQSITCMTRHPSSDILFLGTFESIVVVMWIQSRFFYIQNIMNNSPNPVMDICFHHKSLYSVNEFHSALVVTFGEERPEVKIAYPQEAKEYQLAQDNKDAYFRPGPRSPDEGSKR